MNLQCSVIIGYTYTEISSQKRHRSVQLGAWLVCILVRVQVTEASEVKTFSDTSRYTIRCSLANSKGIRSSSKMAQGRIPATRLASIGREI